VLADTVFFYTRILLPALHTKNGCRINLLHKLIFEWLQLGCVVILNIVQISTGNINCS